MGAIAFPSSPSLNDTYGTWIFNGTYWEVNTTVSITSDYPADAIGGNGSTLRWEGANSSWVGTSSMVITDSADVGVGTSFPTAKLHVEGNAVAKTQSASVTGNTTLDFKSNQNFILTMTGSVTLDAPTTEVLGQSGFIMFVQDVVGSHSVSLSASYKTAGASGITLSSAASSIDVVPYIVAATGSILLGSPQLAFG